MTSVPEAAAAPADATIAGSPGGPGEPAAAAPRAGRHQRPDAQVDLLGFEGRAMASPLRLTLPASTPAGRAEAAWAAVRDEFEAAEQAMSRFRDSSDLTAVNRAARDGRYLAVDRRLVRALVAADRARRLTAGRFEPRVLAELERLGYAGAAIGTSADPGSGSRPDPMRGLDPDPPLVELDRAGRVRVATPLDLGGIGKGLALRWAAARLTRILRPGVGALLEAGGDLVVTGPLGRGGDGSAQPWRIAIEDPLGRADGPAVIDVAAGAVATSSVRLRRWVGPDGGPVHHLIDPTTGRPGGDGLLAVTVAGPDPAWSEVRSKTLFLEGPSSIGPAARALGLAAWWTTGDGRLEMTPAARERTVWVATEAGRPA